MKPLITQFSPVSSHSLLGPNIFLNTPFSKALSLSSPLISDTKFHTHIQQQAGVF
jgi:hypothetical protein